MKHLLIHNLGPLKEADIELKRINVIIGSQSSGKSCVLKTAVSRTSSRPSGGTPKSPCSATS